MAPVVSFREGRELSRQENIRKNERDDNPTSTFFFEIIK